MSEIADYNSLLNIASKVCYSQQAGCGPALREFLLPLRAIKNSSEDGYELPLTEGGPIMSERLVCCFLLAIFTCPIPARSQISQSNSNAPTPVRLRSYLSLHPG